MNDAEHARLADPVWKQWGPYVSERSWGTVREDYSVHGTAWDSFPHDHARSRAYRWNEDGLAGICDDAQTLCMAFAFWNGRDPILKERIFGLTGPQGNHGEDAKEYWFYEDSTPTHSWMRWRYFYPQAEFPYAQLVDENARRGADQPEFELLDTGIFDDDRYWDITVDYAKEAADDIVAAVTIRNAGPDAATLHVMPTLWFRNTWSWGLDDRRPSIAASNGALITEHHELPRMRLTGDGSPRVLFCDNESNSRRLWGVDGTAFPKDAINDLVVHCIDATNPAQTGTKAALWYRVDVAAGATQQITLRIHRDAVTPVRPAAEVLADRRTDADDFYALLTPTSATADEALIMRQALGGMLWSKQFYHYDVARWLDGDPDQPAPPAGRRSGRNAAWRHLNNHDVISMPDKWEYPWYAAWDLAFHTVALAHVDPAFAKEQLILLCREWYMHPNGQLPAYEWAFGDVNPPVHAWAALRVFEIDGGNDFEFLERMLHKLLLNFTWWVNRKDAKGNNVFAGGFLGLDNIGPIDRSAPLPIEGELEQSDGTSWMAMYCLDLLEMSLTLARHDRTYEDLATKLLRALRAHRRGDLQPRSVGRGGRLLLRRLGDHRRAANSAEGPVDGRPAAAGRHHYVGTRDAGQVDRVHSSHRLVLAEPTRLLRAVPHARARWRRGKVALDRVARAAAPCAALATGRDRVPFDLRRTCAFSRASRSPVLGRSRRHDVHRRLLAR